MKHAFVTLVGAGPGDPDLISLKGVKALQRADVVLYDALVHPQILQHSPLAEKIFVGKRAGKHSFKQEEINQLIVEEALKKGHVVRLKGGDPFIFGRGKEEIDYVDSFGISYEVIPGISSINTPGLYGIPLTCRGVNESFWVVTATTRGRQLSSEVDIVSQSSATAVFLMGLGKVEEIRDAYTKHDKGNLPVAIVSKGSLPDGRVIFGTVDTLVELRDKYEPEAPALIMVGAAIGTHEQFEELILQQNYDTFG